MKNIFKIMTLIAGCICFIVAFLFFTNVFGLMTEPFVTILIGVALFFAGAWCIGWAFCIRDLENKTVLVNNKILKLEKEIEELKNKKDDQ